MAIPGINGGLYDSEADKYTGSAVDTNWQDFVSHVAGGLGIVTNPMSLGPGMLTAKNGELGTMFNGYNGLVNGLVNGGGGKGAPAPGSGWYTSEANALGANSGQITWNDPLASGPNTSNDMTSDQAAANAANFDAHTNDEYDTSYGGDYTGGGAAGGDASGVGDPGGGGGNYDGSTGADESGHDYARGGRVRGPGSTTSDSIPAKLSNEEHVTNAAKIRALGDGDYGKGHRVLDELINARIAHNVKRGKHKLEPVEHDPFARGQWPKHPRQ